LEIFDLSLEVKLLVFMLSLKSQNLVLSFLRCSLSMVGGNVKLFSLIIDSKNLRVVTAVNSVLIFEFLSHDINLLSQLTIRSLEFVVLDEILINLILKSLALVLVLSYLGSWWSHLLQMGLFLSKLFTCLLVLVLKY
jgi:hypothetical protein